MRATAFHIPMVNGRRSHNAEHGRGNPAPIFDSLRDAIMRSDSLGTSSDQFEYLEHVFG